MSRVVTLHLVFFLLTLAVGGSASDTPPNHLVKIEVENRSDLVPIVESGINVVQYLGGFALARAGISDIALLNSAGYRLEVLDSDWGYADHYIVSLEHCSDPSRVGRVVYQDSDLAVVRRIALPRAIALGHDGKRLRTTPIRLGEERRRALNYMPDTLPDPLIQEMVDSVDIDTVESYLRSLEGVGTRYSPTLGCSLAAEYIKANFEAAGLSATIKPYAISSMVYDICCVDDSMGWAVDETGGIYRSTDGGVSWEENHKHHRPLLGIYFADTLLGWAVGGDTVLHTTDGGGSWYSQASTGALELFRCTFLDSLRGWASGAASDTTPAAYRTTDGGNTWAYSGLPFAGEFLGISFVDTLRGWTTCMNVDLGACEIYNTTDGGASWSHQYDSSDVVLFGLTFYDSLRGWAAGGDVNTGSALLLATIDGGQTWNRQNTGGWILGDVDFLDSLNGWCTGFASIMRTTDGGTNWFTQFPPDYQLFIALDMLDTLHGLCGGSNGAICGTFNSGTNWFLSNTGGEFVWYNVEGVLPGVDMADDICIICGHHDDISEDPFWNAPGADDNASGVACVLEAARIVSHTQFHRTIKFVTFSGEEQGLLGSAAYAMEAESLGHDIVGVINLDMIGYLDDANHDLEIYCDLPSQWMADTILQFSAAYVPGLVPYKEVDPSMVYSDHSSFWDAGYPAVLHIERAFVHSNPYYHSTGDTVGTLDMPYVNEMVKLGVASIAELADPYVVGIQERQNVAGHEGVLALRVSGNPFRNSVKLSLVNSVSSQASLEIYDTSGRAVVQFESLVGREKAIWWNAGNSVPSGVYFAKLSAGAKAVIAKLVLVR